MRVWHRGINGYIPGGADGVDKELIQVPTKNLAIGIEMHVSVVAHSYRAVM